LLAHVCVDAERTKFLKRVFAGEPRGA
jgi:hypothetical protein